MRTPRAPRLDTRRTTELAAELRERARSWIPSWALADGERDFGRALLEIAARFSSEVAERLDDAGEKMRRGFLDWLAVPREAARPARMPVVFKLAGAARDAVFAPAPVRMQADAAGTNVVFETETDVRLVPGSLQVVVGVDADADAFYLPPPGLNDLKPLEPLPVQWQLKSFAAAGATKLQLDPEAGLAVGMIVEAAGQQYRIDKVDKEIVTIKPPLTAELPDLTVVRKITSFSPFDGIARNRQEHALYLGHMELLDIESAATIAIVGAQTLREGVVWQYGVDPDAEVDWLPLTLAPDDEQQTDAIVLKKPKGPIVPRAIGGKTSRWIRGFTTNVPPGQQPFHPAELSLRINAAHCGDSIPCPPTSETASPAAEGMANTTPLVLESVFFPLGKEPRQFDAFYLGSVEAFSKKGADVQLCFEMADPTFASLSRVLGGQWQNTLAGVAADRALHLIQFNTTSRQLEKFRDREALQPPSPKFRGQGEQSNPVSLDPKPPYRLPMWADSNLDLIVATTAVADVWLWHEHLPDKRVSGWIPFGQIPAGTPSSQEHAAGLIYLEGAPPRLAALRGGILSLCDLSIGPQWTPVPTHDGGNDVLLVAIVPVLEETIFGRLVTSASLGMIGVADDHTLYEVDTAGNCSPLTASDVDENVRPVAVHRQNGDLVIAYATKVAHDITTFHSAQPDTSLPLDVAENVLGFDAVISSPPSSQQQLNFLATVSRQGGADLWSWMPPPANTQLFRSEILAAAGEPGGAPTALDHDVFVPGTHAEVLLAPFDLSQRYSLQADVNVGIVAPVSTPAFQLNDVVTVDEGLNVFIERLIKSSGTIRDGEIFYRIDHPFGPPPVADPLVGFHNNGPALLTGVLPGDGTLKLDPNDQQTDEGGLLFTDGAVRRVVGPIVLNGNDRIATLAPAPNNPIPAPYWNAVPIDGRVAPSIQFDASNNNWDAALLDVAGLVFPGAAPERQRAKAFSLASGNRPLLVVLGEDWISNPPGAGATFFVDAAVGSWTRLLGDTSANPELSWEYWSGKGWWKLNIKLDETLNLKSTGALQFKVPDDIASSDWAGKTSYWIRARLVGGDYGKEQVTVKTKDLGSGVTEQTIDRSTEGIRPPSVVKLHISYRLCAGVLPTFVLAQDSGSLRDQSDANRTPGAIVEAFVPLGLAVGRLSNPSASAETPEACPPPCECSPAQEAAPAVVVLTPAGAARQATGRSIFIGLKAELSGAPVNVLLLVDKEANYEQFAPMKIEALVADRFVPVVADDSTRALGESGLLEMSFSVEPTPRELFGMDDLTWLRLTPRGSDVSDWKPALRGAYLNAVWASAAETLTRELLGSSQGAPDLTFFLARPPVLRDTLELRVKEPLGDEERAELLKGDETRVLSAVDGLPGDWVRWDRVIDPGDALPAARVYALDESNGEIRFGDGQHGRIPPIGRDSIVAFSYKRTELGKSGGDSVPANSITARTALNLVSPVESVEAVFAADQAAGGASPESDERVLRFGTARLRHRQRAVTANDFEDLALESSPDIVQARCFVRPGSVRLVVVMRGENPLPNAAQVRELRRLLLAAAPASLSVPEALQITGPQIRRLRIVLDLRVASLDVAGDVSRIVEQRIRALFDTATGGANKEGWALGENPSEEDIALALIDTRRLEGLGEMALREVLSDGREGSWPGALKRDELAMLHKDALRLGFKTVEVIA